MKEEWRDIRGYEGLYQISNLGRVKSLNYNKTNTISVLKPGKCRGYLQVSLCKNGEHKYFKVHKLVAQAFIPNPNNHPQINHKDENKENNRVDNLEWCTQSYNINYGTRNKKVSEKLKGNTSPMYGKHHTKDTKNRISESHKGKLRTEETKKKVSKTRKEKGLSKGSRNPASRKVQCITTGKKFSYIKEAGEYYKLTDSQIRHITNCCRGKRKSAGKHPITEEKLVWKYID